MAEQLTSGTCVVMEIRQENAVKAFREICGPHDPELSRQGKKFTIRGKFGLDKIQNAVHCTDLPEDGLLEVKHTPIIRSTPGGAAQFKLYSSALNPKSTHQKLKRPHIFAESGLILSFHPTHA